MARATSSLPVPLSPVISTVASLSAIRLISSLIARIGGLSPMMPAMGRVAARAWRRRRTSLRVLRCSTARVTARSS